MPSLALATLASQTLADHAANMLGVHSYHVFYQERAMDIADGKPKWVGAGGQSVLMDEKGGLV